MKTDYSHIIPECVGGNFGIQSDATINRLTSAFDKPLKFLFDGTSPMTSVDDVQNSRFYRKHYFDHQTLKLISIPKMQEKIRLFVSSQPFVDNKIPDDMIEIEHIRDLRFTRNSFLSGNRVNYKAMELDIAQHFYYPSHAPLPPLWKQIIEIASSNNGPQYANCSIIAAAKISAMNSCLLVCEHYKYADPYTEKASDLLRKILLQKNECTKDDLLLLDKSVTLWRFDGEPTFVLDEQSDDDQVHFVVVFYPYHKCVSVLSLTGEQPSLDLLKSRRAHFYVDPKAQSSFEERNPIVWIKEHL